MWFCMSWLIFALCEQFRKIQIFGPLCAQNWVPFLQFLGPLEIVYQWRCRGISYYKIYLTVSRYIIYERARDSLAESIKDMHMIHCKYPNRAQQSSEGRIKNLGLGSKIRTFLGPFWNFLGLCRYFHENGNVVIFMKMEEKHAEQGKKALHCYTMGPL